MTAPYTPSSPGDAAQLERLARQLHEGASLEQTRELVLRAYMLGYSSGCGDAFADRELTLPQLMKAAQDAYQRSSEKLIGEPDHAAAIAAADANRCRDTHLVYGQCWNYLGHDGDHHITIVDDAEAGEEYDLTWTDGGEPS